MIVEKSNINIERSGEFQETNFKISATAATMKLLRDQIYSNKILACIRELACNAYDAHVEAGIKERPITIVLPSNLEPVLKIRDYGRSMSHETVMELYATYGLSTKCNSNDFIGAMGIGKFAAFSYSPSFQLTCIQNGLKRVYNMYIDESEIGKIALLFEGETDELDGTEVSVPVVAAQISLFVKEAQQLFKFWEPFPIVRGNSLFETSANEYVFKGQSASVISEDTDSIILMGNIPYMIPYELFDRLSINYSHVFKNSIVFYANIGDVDIAASRETVALTQKTVDWFKRAVESLESEINNHYLTEAGKASSLYEAKKIYHLYFESNSVLCRLRSGDKFKYNDEIVDTSSFWANGISCSLRRGRSAKYHLKTTEYLMIGKSEDKSAKRLPLDFFRSDPIHCFYYVIGSELSVAKIKNRVRHFLNSHRPNSYSSNIQIAVFANQQEYDDFINKNGIPTDTLKRLISTLPEPPPVNRKPRAPTTKKHTVLKFCNNKFEECDVDISKDSGLYITSYRDEYVFRTDYLIGGATLQAIIDLLIELGSTKPVYVFPNKYASRLDNKKKNWRPLREFAIPFAQKNIGKLLKKGIYFHDELTYELKNTGVLNEDGIRILINLIANNKIKITKKLPFAGLPKIKPRNKYFDTHQISTIYRIFTLLNVNTGERKSNIKNVLVSLHDMSSKFVLLDHISAYPDETIYDEIVFYINAKSKSFKKLENGA